MKTVIIIGALPRSLVNFRGELIRTFVSMGYRVLAVASNAAKKDIDDIKQLGAYYIDCPTKRTSINPFADLQTMQFYKKLFVQEQPEYVISYTIKPVIWSGIALSEIKNVKYSALITGLGYAFEGQGFKRWLIRKVASFLYKKSLYRADQIMFQNKDDLNYFVEHSLTSNSKTYVIPGSGVPVDHFKKEAIPSQPIVFLMVARLLKEKGVFEFVDAACQVKKQFPNVRFQLLGGLDPSPDGINQTIVNEWEFKGCIEYLGQTNDVRPYFSKSHVFVLPSFYREGLPRTILEAMATGRPIITTDNVGCREPVVDGENGWLVPVRDSKSLAKKMIWFIENPERIETMGLASRKMAEDKFDVHKVNKLMLEIMRL